MADLVATFIEGFGLLYTFQWWNTMMESEQRDHLKKIAAFCQQHEGLARQLRADAAVQQSSTHDECAKGTS